LEVAAVDAALLAVKVPISSQWVVVSLVRPVALNLPLGVREGQQRSAERPRALVCVLASRSVHPSIETRIGAGLGDLVTRNICQSRQSLRMQSRPVSRIASRVAIEVKEKRELYRNSSAKTGAVPRAVSRTAARAIDVNRVISISDRICNFFTHLIEDRRRLAPACRSGKVHEVTTVSNSRCHTVRW